MCRQTSESEVLTALPSIINNTPGALFSSLEALLRHTAQEYQQLDKPKSGMAVRALSGGGGYMVMVPEPLAVMHTVIMCSVTDGNQAPSPTVTAIITDPKGAGAAWFGLLASCSKYAFYHTRVTDAPGMPLPGSQFNFALKATPALWWALAYTTAQLLAMQVTVATAAGLQQQAATAAKLLCGVPLSAAWCDRTDPNGWLAFSAEAAAAAAKRLGPQSLLALLQLYGRSLFVIQEAVMAFTLHKAGRKVDSIERSDRKSVV